MTDPRRNPWKAALCAIALAALAAAGVGCNTVEGLGKDIQSAGEAGERAIQGN